jgi:hypothetical protein
MNIELILRMRQMGYTAEQIHARLRHSLELVKLVFEKSDKNKKQIDLGH